MVLFSTFLISTVATILMIPLLINLACKFDILDLPSSRKIHLDPMPRIGGIAMAFGALIPIYLWTNFNVLVKSVIFGSTILVVFGFVDDMKNIMKNGEAHRNHKRPRKCAHCSRREGCPERLS